MKTPFFPQNFVQFFDGIFKYKRIGMMYFKKPALHHRLVGKTHSKNHQKSGISPNLQLPNTQYTYKNFSHRKHP
jgi:hypothetical protein